MPTKTPGLRPACFPMLALLAAITLGLFAVPARANDQLPLHVGSSGTRVCGLKWMISGAHGHRPNVFDKIAGTYHGALCPAKSAGYLGAIAGGDIFEYKYRLGYPAKYNSKTHPVAGAYFFALLRGTKVRPATWTLNAANRVKAVEPGATSMALKVKAYEVHLLDLNVHEVPDGSNRGPRISYSYGGVPAMQSATGAYGVAWCVSTQQTVLKAVGYGTFADDTAGVYYAVDWAAPRNLLHAKPKVGALVAFITYDRNGRRVPGTGHMGFVTKITATGYSYISGNSSNAVNERYYTLGARPAVFIYLPGLA